MAEEVDRWLKFNVFEALSVDCVEDINTTKCKTMSKDAMSRDFFDAVKLLSEQNSYLAKYSILKEENEALKSKLIESQQQVIGLQVELLASRTDQMQAVQATVKTTVEDSVKAEIKSYSKVVQESLPVPTIAHDTVKSIAQAVVQQEDRSRGFMVFNLPEEDDEQLNSKVEEILLELDEKPKIEASRIGQLDSEKVRAVKVTLSNSVAVSQILAKARKLRSSPKYSSVYISQDRSRAEREQHRLLVAELKKMRDADKSRRYYIKGGVICDGGLKSDT